MFSLGSPFALARVGMRFAHSWLGSGCWYLVFSVTSRCNQRCAMCFNWRHEGETDSLSLEEIRRIAVGFPHLFQLTLSGGEPLLRLDLPEIVQAFCSRRPVPRVTVPSNGQLPERLESLADRLCRENPQSTINIALSLDGVGERHDAIRGVSGAFEAYLESRRRIETLRRTRSNLNLVVASVFSALNREHMPDLLRYIESESHPPLHGLMLARGLTRQRQARQVDEGEFLDAIDRLLRMQRPFLSRLGRVWAETYHGRRVASQRARRMLDPCRAGSKLLVLDHRGELSPCELFAPLAEEGVIRFDGPSSFGNLRDVGYRVEALLRTPGAMRLRSFIERGGCWCTFECAMLNNFALNPANYFRMLGKLLWGMGGERP